LLFFVAVRPDFIIARNQVRGPTPDSDRRNVLYGLLMARVPAMNSLHSLLLDLERPVMYGALAEVEQRLGHEKFPLIPLAYYSSYAQMVVPRSDFPFVVKVSHAHRGMGKILCQDGTAFRDVATIIALNNDYATSEPFIDVEYGIRVQRVCGTTRVYKKQMTGSSWKSQFGGSDLQEIPVTDYYKLWADACESIYGGLDIYAIDAVHGKNGKDYILELNGTAIGILSQHWLADTITIRSAVVQKMNKLYVKS